MKYLLLVYSFVLIGCMAPKQEYITPLMVDQHTFYSGFSENKFYIYVSPFVSVKEFVKTFWDRFESGEDFSNYLRNEYEYRFDLIFDESHQTEIVDPLYELEKRESKEFYTELKSLLVYNEIEYLIWVQNITIKNKYSGYAPMMIPTGNGGMMMSGGSSTEYCIVEYVVQVVDPNKWTIVNEFKVVGKASVSFFQFENALLDATENSIENAMQYMTTGRTKKY